MVRPAAVILLALLGAAPALAAARDLTGCPADDLADRLENVSPSGDLILASGRTAVLSSVRLPDDGAVRVEALAWLKTRVGLQVQGRSTAQPDRWGRYGTILSVMRGDATTDLAQGLVEAGLALVDAGTADVLCRPSLLPVEESARKQSLGVWAQDRYKPIDAGQRDRLRDRAGAFVLVEGEVRSVGERRQRTYLNFGEHWAEDFTIIVPKTTWTRMVERGLTAAVLRKGRVRARGILEEWKGTSLTLKAPETIELIENVRPR